MTDDIDSRVRALLAEHLRVETSSVEDDATSFWDDLGADSLDCVEICMAMEDAFEIEIPEDAAREVATVGDVIQVVREALGGKQEAA